MIPLNQRKWSSRITFHITHTENATVITIHGDGDKYQHSVYLHEADLADLTEWRRLIMDGNRVVLLEPCRMVLMDTPDRCGTYAGEDGATDARSHIYHIDTRRFLKALRILRSKKLGHKASITQFRSPDYVPPLYTVQQLLQHDNIRNPEDWPETLKTFRRGMPDAKWWRLMEQLSHYIDRALIYGHKDEFYFDGRRLPNGLGFNGGIILREADFSIHT